LIDNQSLKEISTVNSIIESNLAQSKTILEGLAEADVFDHCSAQLPCRLFVAEAGEYVYFESPIGCSGRSETIFIKFKFV